MTKFTAVAFASTSDGGETYEDACHLELPVYVPVIPGLCSDIMCYLWLISW